MDRGTAYWDPFGWGVVVVTGSLNTDEVKVTLERTGVFRWENNSISAETNLVEDYGEDDIAEIIVHVLSRLSLLEVGMKHRANLLFAVVETKKWFSSEGQLALRSSALNFRLKFPSQEGRQAAHESVAALCRVLDSMLDTPDLTAETVIGFLELVQSLPSMVQQSFGRIAPDASPVVASHMNWGRLLNQPAPTRHIVVVQRADTVPYAA